MTDQKKQDVQVLTEVLHKLTTVQIPRLQRMLDRLNQGEKLSAADINKLQSSDYTSMQSVKRLERNPEYAELASQYVDLYTTVIKKAVENEQNS